MPDFPYLPPPIKGSSAWQPLVAFDDPTLPKLNNLRRAQAAGLRVPPTWWVSADEIALVLNAPPPFSLAQYPLLVRFASRFEDTLAASDGGPSHSVIAAEPALCSEALLQIVNALPRDDKGAPHGAVFVQPLLKAEEAGTALLDGFYYERTCQTVSSTSRTSGQEHKQVRSGHYQRGDTWSELLKSLYAVFGADARQPTQMPTHLQIEYLRRGDRYTVLTVDHTLLPVPRNRTLRLFDISRHQSEIQHHPLSPWTAAALIAAGQDALDFFADCDPAARRWEEPYLVSAAGRVWVNLTVFLRLMDRWGLPRTLVSEVFGGESENPEDSKQESETDRQRLLFASPTLIRLHIHSLREALKIKRKLAALDSEIEAAQTLPELYEANIAAIQLAIRSQFAFDCLHIGSAWLHKLLHISTDTPIAMHSIVDVFQPPASTDEAVPRQKPLLQRHLLSIERRRQRFGDQMRQRWSRLREKLLAEGVRLLEAGQLDAAEDVFFLNPSQDLPHDPKHTSIELKRLVAAKRQQFEEAKAMVLPLTLSADDLY